MLFIERTHSQTMALLLANYDDRGRLQGYEVLRVCHVHDEKTLRLWRMAGAKSPEVKR